MFPFVFKDIIHHIHKVDVKIIVSWHIKQNRNDTTQWAIIRTKQKLTRQKKEQFLSKYLNQLKVMPSIYVCRYDMYVFEIFSVCVKLLNNFEMIESLEFGVFIYTSYKLNWFKPLKIKQAFLYRSFEDILKK